MIKSSSFTKEWILSVKGNERSDQSIIEKQIYALHLLEELNKEFPRFIFKGGTALSLIAETFPRFSVDIDILVEPKDKDYFTLTNLKNILLNSKFKSVSENVRQPKHHIDKQHFEFYFDSIFSEQAYILLDVVYESSHYQDVIKKEIKNHLIDIDHPQQFVNIPSVHDLLSDKLCAFAPNTIGKKLNEGRNVEVIKQMYDVSYLFEQYSLNPTFHSIYKDIANQEIKNRNLNITHKDTAKDTMRTSLNILIDGKIDDVQYQLLKDAIRRYTAFVRDYSFNIEAAKICAINNLFASLLVIVEGNENFINIAKEQKGYLNEYRVFVRVKRWLRLVGPKYYDTFDNCLKVMSYLNINL
ncbi:nucleotidyl transferase AbiEii/AbiGii toxin family protein [Mycoplasmatota bacterium]|nr:nucleotidyl transferase AbiEii/AbiGii toxin family protein [Mycoplasmatota bacterium]